MKAKKRFFLCMIAMLTIMVICGLGACAGTEDSSEPAAEEETAEEEAFDENTEFIVPEYAQTGDLIIVQKGDKVGAVDPKGKQVFAYEYDYIECVGPDRYLVSKSDGYDMDTNEYRNQTQAIVNGDNEEIEAFGAYSFEANDHNEYSGKDDAEWYSLLPAAEGADGDVGFYSVTEDNWAIEPAFKEANPFCDGLAAVKNKDGKWGFINTDGDYVIPARYTELETDASLYEDSFVEAVNEDGKTVYLYGTGEEKDPKDYISIPEGGQVEVGEPLKKKILELAGDELNNIVKGKNFVAVGIQTEDEKIGLVDQWRVYDLSGKEVSDRLYSQVWDYGGGCIAVYDDETATYGLLDENGEEKLPCEYEMIDCLYDSGDIAGLDSDDVALAVRKEPGTLISLYNNQVEELVHEKYEETYGFPDDVKLCAVEADGKVGFIESKGKEVLAPTFEAYSGDDTYSKPGFLNQQFGWIQDSKTGEDIVINSKFKVISDRRFTELGGDNSLKYAVTENYIAEKNSKGCCVLDQDGTETVPFGTYEDVAGIYDHDRFLVKDKGSGKYGFIDAEGKPLTDFKYGVSHATD